VAEVFLQATEEIKQKFAQKVALMKSNAVVAASISQIAAEYNQLGPARRSEMVLLRRRRQDLEMQTALLNHTLGDAISQNSMIAEDNERLRNWIAAIKASNATELEMAMRGRSLAVERLQAEISATQQENAIKIQEIEASVMKFKLLATEYRNASEETREATHARKQENAVVLEDAQAQARILEDEIRTNREELSKGKGILQLSNQQVELLQKKLAESQRTSARQSKLILQLARSQGLLADEVQRLQRTSSGLSDQIANFGKRRFSDDSSEGLVQFEPV
jgi:chromosome segregation ATPase